MCTYRKHNCTEKEKNCRNVMINLYYNEILTLALLLLNLVPIPPIYTCRQERHSLHRLSYLLEIDILLRHTATLSLPRNRWISPSNGTLCLLKCLASYALIRAMVVLAHIFEQALADCILSIIIVLPAYHDPWNVCMFRIELGRLDSILMDQSIALGARRTFVNVGRQISHTRQGRTCPNNQPIILIGCPILVVVLDAIDVIECLVRTTNLGQGAGFDGVVAAFRRTVLTDKIVRQDRVVAGSFLGVAEWHKGDVGHFEKSLGSERFLEARGQDLPANGGYAGLQ